mgnify:FL=1
MIMVARSQEWGETPEGRLTLLCLSEATDEQILNHILAQEVSSEEEISVLLNVLRKERPNVIKMMEEDF